MDTNNLRHEDKVLNFIKINETLEWFGTEISSRTRITPEIDRIHLLHKDMSNFVNYTTNSNGL